MYTSALSCAATVCSSVLFLTQLVLCDSRSVRGAVVFLIDGAPRRVADLQGALESLDERFNNRYGYPVVVFHSIDAFDPHSPPLTEAQQTSLRAGSRSTLIFAALNFTEYAAAPGAAGAPALVYGKSMGYRHMCRFFAGLIAHHPALAEFDFYWRLDSDSRLSENVRYDVFAQLPCHGWRYTYAQTACDAPGVTAGLWQTVASHYAQLTRGGDLAVRLTGILTEHGTCDHSEEAGAQGPAWNNVIFYNNWEIVDLSWLRSAEYADFFAAVDAAGGFYTNRWGDAPVRTLLVHALLAPEEIHRFSYFRFRHDMEWGMVLPSWWRAETALAFPEESGAACLNATNQQLFYEAPNGTPPHEISPVIVIFASVVFVVFAWWATARFLRRSWCLQLLQRRSGRRNGPAKVRGAIF
jgi:hypothetical protein